MTEFEPGKISRGMVENLIPGGMKYLDLPEDYDGVLELISWNGYKIIYTNEAGMNAEFFKEIRERSNKNKAVIIIITAEAGQGKSWFGLRFAQIFDPKFAILDVDEAPELGKDPSQVPFEREHFLHLIGPHSPLKYGQVIMPDEAQYGMGSRDWYDDQQKDLMKQIESVRSKGFIIVIVSLHLGLLDKIIRNYVLTYNFHIEDRGIATVYRLYTPRFEGKMFKKKLGQLILSLPDQEYCINDHCLPTGKDKRGCPHLYGNEEKQIGTCYTIRALYERRKADFVGKRSLMAQEKAEASARKRQKKNDSEYVETIHTHYSELEWNRQKRIDTSSIQWILSEHMNEDISRERAYKYRKRFEKKYPELKNKLEEV